MTTDQRLYLSTQLIRIGQLTSISAIISDILSKENFIAMQHKSDLRAITRNMEQANRRLVGMLTPESQKANETQVMDEESVLQTCAMIDMLIALPKPIRDQIEKYAVGCYNCYSLNAPKT